MTAPWVAAFLLLWVVVLLMLFLQLGQLRRSAEVLEQAESRLRGGGWSPVSMGVPPGSRVPDFEATDSDGRLFSGEAQLGEKSIYLFLGQGCEPCTSLVSDIAREGGWDVGDVDLIAVMADEADVTDVPMGARHVLVRARGVADAFGTSATPHAFAADEAGIVVGKSIPNTLTDLRALADQLMTRDLGPTEATGGR